MKAYRGKKILCAGLLVISYAVAASASDLQFPNRSNLSFDDAVSGVEKNDFGPGWTSATLHKADGNAVKILKDEQLSPTGGIVFSTVGQSAVSPSGRYIMLDIVRNGIGDAEDGGVTVQSRQYCPILDTSSGCLVHDDSGSACGGSWDPKADVWISQVDADRQDRQAIAYMRKPNAETIWTEFHPSNGGELLPLIKNAGGIENIKACDPVNDKNVNFYSKIDLQIKKEGDKKSIKKIGVINSSREYIHDLPSTNSARHGYFIQGDKVLVLDYYGDDWFFVQYNRKNNIKVEGWIQAKNVITPS